MLQELLDILDEEILTKLLFRYAGFSFYIPHEPTLSHPFSLVLNEKEFLQLTEEFGGQTITLPSAKTWLKQFQRRKIHQLKQQNMKHRDIAKQVGCTERWVREVLKRFPPIPPVSC